MSYTNPVGSTIFQHVQGGHASRLSRRRDAGVTQKIFRAGISTVGRPGDLQRSSRGRSWGRGYASHREGDPHTPFRRLYNLARARIVVI